MTKMKVLILCTANSARSQMGEGILRSLAGDALEVVSAGTSPSIVNPYAIRAMAEMGLDISGHRSKHLNEFINEEFDYVITVCDQAAETCPTFPGPAKRIHFSFPDPAATEGEEEATLALFRAVRDAIREQLERWFKAL